jgi:hypothetical protein
MKIFDNVAQLRLARLGTGQLVKTKGYYTANDGGGAEYIIVATGTGTDDGGSYLDLALNQAELTSEGTASIKQFGAIGNGVSNDTAFIQACANYAELTSGIVIIPKGIFLVSSIIDIDSGDVTVKGVGNSSVLKMADAANLTSILIFSSGANSATAFDFKLNGNRTNQTTPTFGGLLESQATTNTKFTRITAVDSLTDGIDIRTNGTGYIEGCYVSNVNLTGAKVTDVKQSRVINNTFINCQTSVNVLTRGEDCVISNNTIIGDNDTISITGIIVTIDVAGLDTSKRVSVANNTIFGCTASSGGGINLVSDLAARANAYCSVVGNIITNCRDGILSSNSKSFSILGNIITNSSIRGLSLSGCSDVSVQSNIFNEHDNHASASQSIAVNSNASSGNSNNISILGNTINNTTTVNSPVGVFVVNSSQTDIVVLGNQINGCTTPVSSGASIVSKNGGYVTSNTGSATINSGSTSVGVTHGLDMTPQISNINIAWSENPTADVGNFWISSISSTTFTVNVRNDPSTSNLSFSWAVFD